MSMEANTVFYLMLVYSIREMNQCRIIESALGIHTFCNGYLFLLYHIYYYRTNIQNYQTAPGPLRDRRQRPPHPANGTGRGLDQQNALTS